MPLVGTLRLQPGFMLPWVHSQSLAFPESLVQPILTGHILLFLLRHTLLLLLLLPRSRMYRQLHLRRVLLLHVGHMCLLCSA